MAVNLARIQTDLPELAALKPPVQRAAYSDRTAWLMSILAELAYLPFDGGDPKLIARLAAELAKAVGIEEHTKILEEARSVFRSTPVAPEEELRKVLSLAGFNLIGTFFQDGTEGYVTSRPTSDEDLGMAVLVFRGTTNLVDWKTNLNAELKRVGSQNAHASAPEVAGLLAGFVEAYERVEDEVHDLIGKVSHQPLYIAGHSLGGALAIVATWKIKGARNAACYTFGSPRVGNSLFADRFKTPIYRVVNGHDPVPFVPPAGIFIDAAKVIVRVFPLRLDPVINYLVSIQGYRHFGDIRYFTAPWRGNRPAQLLKSVGVLERLLRTLPNIFSRRVTKLVKFHDISAYRGKLRAYALARNNQSRTEAGS